MATPRLTVCVATHHGRAAMLAELLDDLVGQRDHRFDVVICDNGSTDETAAIVERARAAGLDIDYRRHAADVGAARNIAATVEHARGEHCWLLGSDDRLMPGAVARVLELLAAYPDAAGLTVHQAAMDFTMTWVAAEQASHTIPELPSVALLRGSRDHGRPGLDRIGAVVAGGAARGMADHDRPGRRRRAIPPRSRDPRAGGPRGQLGLVRRQARARARHQLDAADHARAVGGAAARRPRRAVAVGLRRRSPCAARGPGPVRHGGRESSATVASGSRPRRAAPTTSRCCARWHGRWPDIRASGGRVAPAMAVRVITPRSAHGRRLWAAAQWRLRRAGGGASAVRVTGPIAAPAIMTQADALTCGSGSTPAGVGRSRSAPAGDGPARTPGTTTPGGSCCPGREAADAGWTFPSPRRWTPALGSSRSAPRRRAPGRRSPPTAPARWSRCAATDTCSRTIATQTSNTS